MQSECIEILGEGKTKRYYCHTCKRDVAGFHHECPNAVTGNEQPNETRLYNVIAENQKRRR